MSAVSNIKEQEMQKRAGTPVLNGVGTAGGTSAGCSHRSVPLPPPTHPLSIRGALAGTSVLITGGTGYLGQLVLEQLLRCVPDIGTIYLLCRDKRGLSAESRIRRLLHSGLFHLVRDRPELRAKVVLVKGDLLSAAPMLGIPTTTPDVHLVLSGATETEAFRGNEEDEVEEEGRQDVGAGGVDCADGVAGGSMGAPAAGAGTRVVGAGRGGPEVDAGPWDAAGRNTPPPAGVERLAAEPHLLIIHSAARITLEDPIQTTLRHNYMGTRAVLELASQLPGLAGFLHVSTSFVNCCKPFLPEGQAEERLYPLRFGDREIDHAWLVADLMSMPPDLANMRSKYLCDLWGFPNSYVLGKHLTEQLVRDFHARPAPVAMVRPSLVSAVAGAPYPGYVGNLAGPSGYAVAFALGFFAKNSVSWTAFNHHDSVPGDVASSLIIAAAAALVERVDVAALPPPPSTTDAPPMPLPATASAVPYTCALEPASSGSCLVSDTQQPIGVTHGYGSPAPALPPLAIYHAASSALQPLSHLEVYALALDFYSKHPPKFRIGKYVPVREGYVMVPWRNRLARAWVATKVRVAASLLSCFGQSKASRQLTLGHAMWDQTQDPKNNFRLYFSARNALALEACLSPAERADFPLVWRGDWLRFAQTYMAAVMRLFLKQEVPQEARGDWVHIPSRHVV